MSSGLAPTRALVTGANGFVGHHVVAELASRGWSVIAASRQKKLDPQLNGSVDRYLTCDLAELEEVRRLPLEEVDVVINLAGLAAVGDSFSQPDLYLRVNRAVIDTVCSVALERGLRSLRVIAVSSGAVYAAGQTMPLAENSAVDPASSPYAKSKIAMEERARFYRDQGLDCVVVRPFNHIGPGQGLGFLIPDLVEQVESARAERRAVLVGNLSSRRDYTDVRDVAAAYADLAGAGRLAEAVYNVCSGRSVSGSEILMLVMKALGAPDLEVATDPSRFRPVDQHDIVGDSGRLRASLGWAPSIPIEVSIADFVAARTQG